MVPVGIARRSRFAHGRWCGAFSRRHGRRSARRRARAGRSRASTWCSRVRRGPPPDPSSSRPSMASTRWRGPCDQAAERTVGLVRDPALEVEVLRLTPARSSGTRRPGRGRGRSPRRAGLGRGPEASSAIRPLRPRRRRAARRWPWRRGAARARRSRRCSVPARSSRRKAATAAAGARPCCSDRRLLEQRRVVHGRRAAGRDERQVARDIGPHRRGPPPRAGARPPARLDRARPGRPRRDRRHRPSRAPPRPRGSRAVRPQPFGRVRPAPRPSRTVARAGRSGDRGRERPRLARGRPRAPVPGASPGAWRPGGRPATHRAGRAGSGRARRAAGARRGHGRRPGRCPGLPAGHAPEPGGRRRIGGAAVGEDRLDVARADRAQPDPCAARADGRQEPGLVVGAQDDRHAGRRLLERLEQRRLGVLVHAVRRSRRWPRARRPRAAAGRGRR